MPTEHLSSKVHPALGSDLNFHIHSPSNFRSHYRAGRGESHTRQSRGLVIVIDMLLCLGPPRCLGLPVVLSPAVQLAGQRSCADLCDNLHLVVRDEVGSHGRGSQDNVPLRSLAAGSLADWPHRVPTKAKLPGGCSGQGLSMAEARDPSWETWRGPPLGNAAQRLPLSLAKPSLALSRSWRLVPPVSFLPLSRHR